MPDENQNQMTAISQRRNHVRDLLERAKPQFAEALPRHVSPEKLLRVAMTAISANPKLLEAETSSLLSCIMTAAQLGLLPDGVLGQAYLVPFNQGFGNNKRVMCQLIVGYRGLITLARNSGEIESIAARVVYEGDQFRYEFGINEQCMHVPCDAKERGEVTHAYAVARFKDGGHCFDVLTRGEVDKIMLGSQGFQAAEKKWSGKPAKQNSPWHLHFDEMARKTAIRRISKYLPMSVQKAVAIEGSYDSGGSGSIDMQGDVILQMPPEVIEDKQGEPDAPDANADQSALDEFADETEANSDQQDDKYPDFPGDLSEGETVAETGKPKNTASKSQ